MLYKENAKSFEIINDTIAKRPYKVYIFECTSCGNDIKSQSGQLKRHSGKCVSCSHKGKPYEAVYNELRKTCSRRDNCEITLVYEQFIELIKVGKCHYCEKDLIFSKHSRDSNSKLVSRAYQLDRKDNKIGYIFENLVPCCWECNRLKSNVYTYEEFLKLSPILKEIQKERELCTHT